MNNRKHLKRLPDVIHTKNFNPEQYVGIAGWFFDVRDYLELKDYSHPAKMPIFHCPTCNEIATVDHHSIKSDGEINASVLCRTNCGYHEFCILDDWPTNLYKNVGDLFVREVEDASRS